ncbi:MAG: hypothetical protein WBB29_05730 [Geitlerinemataceae cyanobacterium]
MPYPNAPDVTAENYVAVGLATCFIREDGEVQEVQIIEPIPSAALEALLKGTPTSYQVAYARTLGEILDGETPIRLPEFPAEAQFCDEFAFRAIAATRTYNSRPAAQSHIPLGTKYDRFEFSLDRKRVLNIQRVISTEDNVKQHDHTHKVL